MTLQTSGAITIGNVAAELGIGLPLDLGDSRVRTLAGVPSGAISLSNLYGKSNYTPMNISTTGGTSAVDTSGSQGGVTFYKSASCAVSSGTGGYTYSWSIIANASPAFSFYGTSTAASIQVQVTTPAGTTIDTSCTLRCTVNDNTAHSVYSDCVVRIYGSGVYTGGS